MKLQDGKHEAVNEMLMRSLKILSYRWPFFVHKKSNVNITSKGNLKSHRNNINEVANQVEHVGLYEILSSCALLDTLYNITKLFTAL